MPDKEWLYPNLHENGYTYSVLENLHYIPHVHGGLECVYVLDGELCATIDEKNYTLKKALRRWLCTPQPDLPCRELFATHPRNY